MKPAAKEMPQLPTGTGLNGHRLSRSVMIVTMEMAKGAYFPGASGLSGHDESSLRLPHPWQLVLLTWLLVKACTIHGYEIKCLFPAGQQVAGSSIQLNVLKYRDRSGD